MVKGSPDRSSPTTDTTGPDAEYTVHTNFTPSLTLLQTPIKLTPDYGGISSFGNQTVILEFILPTLNLQLTVTGSWSWSGLLSLLRGTTRSLTSSLRSLAK